MRDIFLEVMSRSMAAGWLVLTVAVLRVALKRAPKAVRMLLWGMVALRLLCPVSIESRFSLIPEGQAAPWGVLAEERWNRNEGLSPGNGAGNASGEVQISGAGNGQAGAGSDLSGKGELSADGRYGADGFDPWGEKWNIIDTLSVIWLFGGLAMGLYALLTYLRLRKLVGTAVVMQDNIFQSERVASPFVLGLVRPKIYLPFRIEGKNLEHVVMHEQVHIRRKDHWWKPLGYALLSVYWFHPLMWLAYGLLSRDIELACDERTIRGLDDGQRADYSQALLDCSVSRRSICACPLAFGETGVKTRVKSVLHYRKPTFWIVGLAAVVCIVVAVCFLTNPARDSDRRDTLAWAQTFSAREVESADLVVTPRSPGKEYKRLSESDIAAMVKLLNQSEGTYREEQGIVEGGSTFFYLTMEDGSAHVVGNLADTYLVIDGEYYEADADWLASWNEAFPEGEEALPEGYFDMRSWFGQMGTGQTGGQEAPGKSGAGESGQPGAGQAEPGGPGFGQSAETVVWEDADLDRDGEAETIRVREVLAGELYLLEVLKQDGTVLWSEEAGMPHVGWNTILLCQSGGEDYLVRYHPNVSQGIGSYTCEQFTLAGGQETQENFWEADFELASALQTTGKMRAFAEVANEFLKNGTVLLSTWEGELVIGPRPASKLQTLYPVRFGQEDGEGYPEEDAWWAFDSGLPEDTPPLEFIMASGASSSYTRLSLHPDGSFEGFHSDNENMAAEEYPQGTRYYCEFTGRFDEITKIDEYSFSMRLAELNYGTERDKVWIQDEVRYIGSEAFGVERGEDFRFYLPGAPLGDLDEAFTEWSPDYYLWRDGAIDRLSSYGLYNVEGGYGFFTSWLD
ncbi:MAG: M56 family metallopeptidase [Lachnospiraceae bacterium]|jgi:beta-lactamase regulating signal transducer with metallopeptidase domain|nr:M56 family metallopeptidase [uncultured Acetatifactor sp.]MCI9221295.1 M56 family metallopeptidase [Lachnospiraceae bacterium]